MNILIQYRTLYAGIRRTKPLYTNKYNYKLYPFVLESTVIGIWFETSKIRYFDISVSILKEVFDFGISFALE